MPYGLWDVDKVTKNDLSKIVLVTDYLIVLTNAYETDINILDFAAQSKKAYLELVRPYRAPAPPQESKFTFFPKEYTDILV